MRDISKLLIDERQPFFAKPGLHFAALNNDPIPLVHGVGVLTKEEWEELRDRIDSFYRDADEAFILALDEQIRNRPPYAVDAPALRPKEGWVYLMRNNRNGYYKIGFSYTPQYREKTLQAEEPDIVLLDMFKGTMDDEAGIHFRLRRNRVRGEWFALSSDDLEHWRSTPGRTIKTPLAAVFAALNETIETALE